MEGADANAFLAYHARIRERTDRLLPLIPEESLEWTCSPGRFTLGDLLRHLAGTERFMWAENALGNPGRYPGHGRHLADGYQATLDYYRTLRDEARTIFSGLNDDDLRGKAITPAGQPITLWKWLRAMTEHEIHHRGQLYLYLGMLQIPTPPLFGLPSEDLIRE